jgi:hypothetical protein
LDRAQTHVQCSARLADYLALQLQFAAHYAHITASSLSTAVAHCTNFRRRFGLWPEDIENAMQWTHYLQHLDTCDNDARRLAWTLRFLTQCPEERAPALYFGCFNYDPPDASGLLRIHFVNREPPGSEGPLHSTRQHARHRELRAMFKHIRITHPSATHVKGFSWLYNIEAYRRLYPPAFSASRAPPNGPIPLTGSSSWGQVVDHRLRVKADVQHALIQNLLTMDPATPWRVFPRPALETHAPISLFYAHYAC